MSNVYNMTKEFVKDTLEMEIPETIDDEQRKKDMILERLDDIKHDPFESAAYSILSFLEIRAIQRRERSTEWRKRYDIACRRNLEYKNQIRGHENKISRLNHAVVLLEGLNADIMKHCRAVSRRQKTSFVDLNKQLGLLREIVSTIPSFLYSNNKRSSDISSPSGRREIPQLREQQRRLRMNKFESACVESRMTRQVESEKDGRVELKLPELIDAECKHRKIAQDYIRKKQESYQKKIDSRLRNLNQVIGVG